MALARRKLTIGSGCAHAYDAREWHGALVLVERGELELHSTCGSRLRLGCGAVLFLQGLSLRALHSIGEEPLVLVAITRR